MLCWLPSKQQKQDISNHYCVYVSVLVYFKETKKKKKRNTGINKNLTQENKEQKGGVDKEKKNNRETY